MKGKLIRTVKKHIPLLLCLVSAGGVAATAFITAKCTPKAIDILAEKEKEKGEELTLPEKIKAATPVYIPAMATGALTVMCIFGANYLNKRRQASLVSAYALLSRRYRRYTDKVKDTYGEEAHNAILNSISIEKAEDVPICAPSLMCCMHSIDCSGEKKHLFYDGYSQRFFESTIGQVLQAEYHINRNFSLGGDVTLNDFYLFLGIDKIEGGDDIGWYWPAYELSWIDFENTPMKLDDGTEYYFICSEFEPEPYSADEDD